MKRQIISKAGLCTVLITAGLALSGCQIPGFSDDVPEKEIVTETEAEVRQEEAEQVSEITDEELSQSEDTLVKNQNAWIRYAELIDNCEKKPGENVVFSPLSYDLALGMLANGGSDKVVTVIQDYFGETVDEINATASKYGEGDNTLKTANSIWVTDDKRYVVNKDYKKLINEIYHARVSTVDFTNNEKCKDIINSWTKKKTNGKIEEAISDIDSRTRSILVNALYFNDEFENHFTPEGKMSFDNADGNRSEVEMMSNKCHKYYENNYAIGCEVPYKNPRYSLVLFLPKTEGNFQFLSLDLPSLMDSGEEKTVNLCMPKFETQTSLDLKEYLEGKGITNMSFNRIFESHPLSVDAIRQIAMIKVNEKGTEAAAVTTVEMVCGATLDELEAKSINLNRPFGYAIMDKETSMPVFIGKVAGFQ